MEQKQIKYYQLYLGATIISDITTVDGVTLDLHMRSGNRSLFSSQSKQVLSKQVNAKVYEKGTSMN
eukprot:11981907-Ditylum_brightwellii.AAC.1